MKTKRLLAILLFCPLLAFAVGETTGLQSWFDTTDAWITSTSTSLTGAVARLAAAESTVAAQAATTAALQATVTTQAATAAALQVTVGALAARVAVLEAAPPGTIPPPPPPAVGTGLTGQYYNDPGTGSFFTKLVLTRNDPAINFSWVNGSPDPLVTPDNFSVRWTGVLLAPSTGNYVFRTDSDDGVRLWVNNVQVINNWTRHAPTADFSAPVALVAGMQYSIGMEYYEGPGGATCILSWTPPGGVQAVIPKEVLFPSMPAAAPGAFVLGTPPRPGATPP